MTSDASPGASLGCYCNDGFWGNSPLTTSGSCLGCYQECATCNQASICLTCISSNASPGASQGCTCDNGFWGTAPLTSINSCVACYDECSTCTEASICLSCISSNSSPDPTQGCTCSNGFWGTAPLTSSSSCTSCYSECVTCTQSLLCSTCISSNSSPSSVAGCACDPGYWGVSPLTSLSSCSLCYTDCATCSQSLLCLTCTSLNAHPDSVQGCVCNDGYYNSASASASPPVCSLCYSECATCDDPSICLTCTSQNAQPDPVQGCQCNTGFLGTHPLVTSAACYRCQIDCSSCSQSLGCIKCQDSNASPNSSVATGCKCNQGFYQFSTGPLHCNNCPESCITCTNSTMCTICNVTYSNPTQLGTCVCPDNSNISNYQCVCGDGYYLEYDSTDLVYVCMPCHKACSTCIDGGTHCTVCKTPLEFDTSNSCSICPSGTYFSDYSCLNCSIDCTTCSAYNFCITCSDSLKQVNSTGSCNIFCPSGEILVDNWCYPCISLCETCSTKTTCDQCVSNAILANGQCSCILGYQSNGTNCVEYYFTASLGTSFTGNKNKLQLFFSAPPTILLYSSNFSVTAPGLNITSIGFYMKDPSTFIFSLLFDMSVPDLSPVLVTILQSPLYSTENSQLQTYTLEGSLHKFDPIRSSTAVKAVTAKAAAASQAAVSTSLGSALLSNPAAAWAMINTIQIIAYIPISANPLTPNLQAFYNGLNNYNSLIPNPMAYAFSSNSTSPPYTEASNYGINTSVFWVNIGNDATSFLFLLGLWPFMYVLSKLKLGKIALKFAKYLGNYRYSVFLRFWIQAYLDAAFYAIIQLKAVSFI